MGRRGTASQPTALPVGDRCRGTGTPSVEYLRCLAAVWGCRSLSRRPLYPDQRSEPQGDERPRGRSAVLGTSVTGCRCSGECSGPAVTPTGILRGRCPVGHGFDFCTGTSSSVRVGTGGSAVGPGGFGGRRSGRYSSVNSPLGGHAESEFLCHAECSGQVCAVSSDVFWPRGCSPRPLLGCWDTVVQDP